MKPRTRRSSPSSVDTFTPTNPQSYEGPCARVLGLLEASLGRLDEAGARLERARAQCGADRLRPWVARLSLERGNVSLTAGRTNEARELFEEAAALGTELGMKRRSPPRAPHWQWGRRVGETNPDLDAAQARAARVES